MPENYPIDQNIIKWCHRCLSSQGYTLKKNLPETVVNTPWSSVTRFDTTDGYIYLKHTPEHIALEARIIQTLHDQFHISVPEVIEHNADLNCFLMKDAGQSLRAILKNKFDTKLFCKAIHQFTSMQLSVADHTQVFLDIGVPDWRLDKLPDLYKQLLTQKEILIADGLSENEINQLEALLPTVAHLCQKLSDYAIKQSIVQPDFSDNNTLIADKSSVISIIDLGEIAISHPFFSLLNCLYVAKKHHQLTDNDDRYLKLQDACLENYLIFGSKKQLLAAISIVRELWFVYAALCNYRLQVACKEFSSSFERHGRPGRLLKEFMAICMRHNKPL